MNQSKECQNCEANECCINEHTGKEPCDCPCHRLDPKERILSKLWEEHHYLKKLDRVGYCKLFADFEDALDHILSDKIGEVRELKAKLEKEIKPLSDEYSWEYKLWLGGSKTLEREKILKEYEDGAKGNRLFSLNKKLDVVNEILDLLSQPKEG